MTFIDQHRDTYGVQPICALLPIAPCTYFLRKAQQQDATTRAQREDELRTAIQRVWDNNDQVYGPRKVWRQLRREGVRVARCTVERLMHAMGLRGVSRGRACVITTRADAAADRPADLVTRHFAATRPNQLWVTDFTYVATWRGFVYVAFVIDVFARRIAGWRVSASLGDRLRARCRRAGHLRPARPRRHGPRPSQRSRHAAWVQGAVATRVRFTELR